MSKDGFYLNKEHDQHIYVDRANGSDSQYSVLVLKDNEYKYAFKYNKIKYNEKNNFCSGISERDLAKILQKEDFEKAPKLRGSYDINDINNVLRGNKKEESVYFGDNSTPNGVSAATNDVVQPSWPSRTSKRRSSRQSRPYNVTNNNGIGFVPSPPPTIPIHNSEERDPFEGFNKILEMRQRIKRYEQEDERVRKEKYQKTRCFFWGVGALLIIADAILISQYDDIKTGYSHKSVAKKNHHQLYHGLNFALVGLALMAVVLIAFGLFYSHIREIKKADWKKKVFYISVFASLFYVALLTTVIGFSDGNSMSCTEMGYLFGVVVLLAVAYFIYAYFTSPSEEKDPKKPPIVDKNQNDSSSQAKKEQDYEKGIENLKQLIMSNTMNAYLAKGNQEATVQARRADARTSMISDAMTRIENISTSMKSGQISPLDKEQLMNEYHLWNQHLEVLLGNSVIRPSVVPSVNEEKRKEAEIEGDTQNNKHQFVN